MPAAVVAAQPDVAQTGLLPVDEARARIIAAMPLLAPETVVLGAALGRSSIEDLHARVSHPPMPVSAMDGYALRSGDARAFPVRLRKLGVSRAGARFDGSLEPGSCVRVFTGAMVPDGADMIALQEDATEDGDCVIVREAGRAGQHIRRAGLDFGVGDLCVARGRALTARDLGLLAACGHTHVAVRRRPRIAILSTGDELVAPGAPIGPDQIVGSNGVALAAAVQAWGADAVDLGIVADRIDAIAQAVDRAAGADLLVTTGGASVGDHDLVRPGAASRGLVTDFWRIAMRPGKPLMFGRIGSLPLLGMPGNPVSALVCALLFLKPAIAAMSGDVQQAPVFEQAILGKPMAANDKREDYVRARIVAGDGQQLTADPFPTQDSGMLLTLARADGLIRRRPFAPAAKPGELVDVIRFGSEAGLF
jgi:molybdopterin molybdotransferase